MIKGWTKATNLPAENGLYVCRISNGFDVYKKEIEFFNECWVLSDEDENVIEWLDESTPADNWVKGIPQDELIEEMWDEYSEHIGDNISDLERIAGGCVITEHKFKSIIERYAINRLPSLPKS